MFLWYIVSEPHSSAFVVVGKNGPQFGCVCCCVFVQHIVFRYLAPVNTTGLSYYPVQQEAAKMAQNILR
jgi:hypothetical protein